MWSCLRRDGEASSPVATRWCSPLRSASPRWWRARDLGPLDIRQVRRTPEETLVKSLVGQHHYLGYAHPVGEHL